MGMGRIVGDGALNFDIVDVAVDPLYQGKGLGRVIMETLVAWLDTHACKGAYVCLMADVPELYAKFGFYARSPGKRRNGQNLVTDKLALRQKKNPRLTSNLGFISGGSAEIRTLEPFRVAVFKTGAFKRSATLPK